MFNYIDFIGVLLVPLIIVALYYLWYRTSRVHYVRHLFDLKYITNQPLQSLLALALVALTFFLLHVFLPNLPQPLLLDSSSLDWITTGGR